MPPFKGLPWEEVTSPLLEALREDVHHFDASISRATMLFSKRINLQGCHAICVYGIA